MKRQITKNKYSYNNLLGFPGVSNGKESTCYVGDLGSGMATHSSILAWRIPWDREAWQAIVHGVAKSWTQLSN